MCVSVCVHLRVCVCVWLFYEAVAGGSWQDAALMRGSFKGPISVYSPADQSIESFAEIWPLFSLSVRVGCVVLFRLFFVSVCSA